MGNKGKKSNKEFLYYLNLALGMGFSIVFSIGVGAAMGYGLDYWLLKKIGPFFMLGLLLGLVGGFYQAYKSIMNKEFMGHE